MNICSMYWMATVDSDMHDKETKHAIRSRAKKHILHARASSLLLATPPKSAAAAAAALVNF